MNEVALRQMKCFATKYFVMKLCFAQMDCVGVTLVAPRKNTIKTPYFSATCASKKTHLISPHDIAKALSSKIILSVSEIDEVMASLSNQNYIDFVVSDSKNGYFYCVKLKKKGQTYLSDSKRQKKALGLLILRSIFLATVSFVFGLILKAIFKS